jgi:hypothetical protein
MGLVCPGRVPVDFAELSYLPERSARGIPCRHGCYAFRPSMRIAPPAPRLGWCVVKGASMMLEPQIAGPVNAKAGATLMPKRARSDVEKAMRAHADSRTKQGAKSDKALRKAATAHPPPSTDLTGPGGDPAEGKR